MEIMTIQTARAPGHIKNLEDMEQSPRRSPSTLVMGEEVMEMMMMRTAAVAGGQTATRERKSLQDQGFVKLQVKVKKTRVIMRTACVAWTNVPGARILASAAIPIQSPKTK